MIQNRLKQRISLLLTGLIISTSLLGCTSEPKNTSSTSAPTASSTESTINLNDRPADASGTLRLWRSRLTSLNPLLEKSQSGQAANDLVFEGLFKIDHRQQIQPALATKLLAIDGSGGLLVQIQLTDDRVFHNGSPLTATDVKACIDFVLTHPGESPYAVQIASIVATQVIDASTIQLTLNQASPWLAYALTFPIIPASSLSAAAFALVPGTGSFKMTSYTAAAGMELVNINASADANSLKSIHITEFDSLTDAMKAYEADQIDLINLPPDVYNRYRLRNSLHFEQYSTNQIVFLAYNTKQNAKLADRNRLLYIKQLLSSGKFSAAGTEDWGENTLVPLPIDSWLIDGTFENAQGTLDKLGSGDWGGYSGELNILVPANETFLVDASAILVQILKTAGVRCKITALTNEAYLTALTNGKYDLALLQSVMPSQPDVMWLYSDSRPASFALLNGLTGAGLTDYDLWRQKLALLLPQVAAGQDAAELPEDLYETAARSPWSVLLIRTAAILYGDRIIGQCRPDINHPYEGIEELWIWSGQSS